LRLRFAFGAAFAVADFGPSLRFVGAFIGDESISESSSFLSELKISSTDFVDVFASA